MIVTSSNRLEILYHPFLEFYDKHKSFTGRFAALEGTVEHIREFVSNNVPTDRDKTKPLLTMADTRQWMVSMACSFHWKTTTCWDPDVAKFFKTMEELRMLVEIDSPRIVLSGDLFSRLLDYSRVLYYSMVTQNLRQGRLAGTAYRDSVVNLFSSGVPAVIQERLELLNEGLAYGLEVIQDIEQLVTQLGETNTLSQLANFSFAERKT